MSKKTLEELVFHDDFMFAAVMMDAENCRCFLERVLEIAIEKVEINTEHSFFFNPECKSIRMDVFAKDVNRTHYDIEMQLVKKTVWKSEAVIIIARWMWKCWKKERDTASFLMPTSFLYATLIRLVRKNAVIPFANIARKPARHLRMVSARFFEHKRGKS